MTNTTTRAGMPPQTRRPSPISAASGAATHGRPAQGSPTGARRSLLLAGAAAGPLFITAVAAQVATRDGFELGRHALSLLALGPHGWIQVATFVLTGGLLITAGVGLSRALAAGPGSVWAPRAVAGFGLGMVLAGVFVADPAFGYPVGTPDGPGSISWHGGVHAVGFMIAMLSWTAACIWLARWYRSKGARGWAAAHLVAVPVALALGAAPYAGTGVRTALVSALQLGLIAATCVRANRVAQPH